MLRRFSNVINDGAGFFSQENQGPSRPPMPKRQAIRHGECRACFTFDDSGIVPNQLNCWPNVTLTGRLESYKLLSLRGESRGRTNRPGLKLSRLTMPGGAFSGMFKGVVCTKMYKPLFIRTAIGQSLSTYTVYDVLSAPRLPLGMEEYYLNSGSTP